MARRAEPRCPQARKSNAGTSVRRLPREQHQPRSQCHPAVKRCASPERATRDRRVRRFGKRATQEGALLPCRPNAGGNGITSGEPFRTAPGRMKPGVSIARGSVQAASTQRRGRIPRRHAQRQARQEAARNEGRVERRAAPYQQAAPPRRTQISERRHAATAAVQTR